MCILLTIYILSALGGIFLLLTENNPNESIKIWALIITIILIPIVNTVILLMYFHETHQEVWCIQGSHHKI